MAGSGPRVLPIYLHVQSALLKPRHRPAYFKNILHVIGFMYESSTCWTVGYSSMVRLAIIVSEFNYDITSIMLQKAESHARFLGAEVSLIFKVPGTYDAPYAVASVMSREDVDAVVVLGAVIKGETDHDQVVAHQAARKILDIGVEAGKPVSLGIIGPGVSRLDAMDRAEEYAARAVESAVKMAKRLKKLRETGEESKIIE